MKNLGVIEIGVLILIGILIFGGKKIAELIRGLAEAIREYRKSSRKE